jgi:hypothetical protein
MRCQPGCFIRWNEASSLRRLVLHVRGLLLLLLQGELPPALTHELLLPQVLRVALPQVVCLLQFVCICCRAACGRGCCRHGAGCTCCVVVGEYAERLHQEPLLLDLQAAAANIHTDTNMFQQPGETRTTCPAT